MCETGTPPAKLQTRPVPAQAMHLRKPRRSMPSGLVDWASSVDAMEEIGVLLMVAPWHAGACTYEN
jgi:hypothetical protein